MSAVSNSSPLISLARIGQLGLLRQLHGEMVIPDAVWREVVIAGAGQPGADDVRTATWIQRQSVVDQQLVWALRQELGSGEAEAIVLSLETGVGLLLMDERLGRATARHLGLRCVGLVGLLTEAKRRGLINEVRPYLDAPRTRAGFHIGDELQERVLRDEGEV